MVDEARIIDLLADTSGGYLDHSEISAAARALRGGDTAPLLRMAAETDFPWFTDQGDPRFNADGDFAATSGTWEVMLKCGDPSIAEVGATFSTDTTVNGWFGMPDNCAVDSMGRLWVSTDGNSPSATGRTDGLWAVDTEGEARRTSKLFFRVPVGAEMCGPLFTPNDETAFVAVQHPADGGDDWEGFGRVSYYEDPSTRWPDFDEAMPTRPSVVVITKQGGGKIAV